MIERLKIIRANGFYPYRNQAIERALLDDCEKGEMILYLWQNDKTVFIGKNQNAFTECRAQVLFEDGGYVARRFTGGGAVYHDKGNLNFTFIAPREDYSLENQFSILSDALRSLGFEATLSGRNDVLIDGKKISGNAFYQSGKNCLHHGTVLISSDREAIAKYLTVSRVKLSAKGVKSVQSRVANLCDFRSGVNAESVAAALTDAFSARYPGAEKIFLGEDDLSSEEIGRLTAHFADRTYILGDDVKYSVSFERRYEWGVADVRLEMKGDVIEKARIYSDALDVDAVAEKERLLTGTDVKAPADGRVKDIIETITGEIGK